LPSPFSPHFFHLQNNKLEKIPPGAFSELSNLRELYLQNNYLTDEGLDNETFWWVCTSPHPQHTLAPDKLLLGPAYPHQGMRSSPTSPGHVAWRRIFEACASVDSKNN
jgi:Leucine-rich repeat (LRR) protein